MLRFCLRTLAAVFVCLLPIVAAGQGRTAGQIVGTVKDATGAVVQNADVVLIDVEHQDHRHHEDRSERQLHVSESAAGPLSGDGHVPGLPAGDVQDVSSRRRARSTS